MESFISVEAVPHPLLLVPEICLLKRPEPVVRGLGKAGVLGVTSRQLAAVPVGSSFSPRAGDSPGPTVPFQRLIGTQLHELLSLVK